MTYDKTFKHWKDEDYNNTYWKICFEKGTDFAHDMKMGTYHVDGRTVRKILRSVFLYEKANEILKDYKSKQLKIAEFGSNNGRNLYLFDKDGHSVYGLDISEKAINSAKKNFNNQKDNFMVLDLFNETEKLKKYKDNFFDFSFTCCFLMHLPPTEEKSKLVNEIVRVSQNVVFLEQWYNKPLDYKGNGWYSSVEDLSVHCPELEEKVPVWAEATTTKVLKMTVPVLRKSMREFAWILRK